MRCSWSGWDALESPWVNSGNPNCPNEGYFRLSGLNVANDVARLTEFYERVLQIPPEKLHCDKLGLRSQSHK